jgi:ATP-dependent DNA helicase RecG
MNIEENMKVRQITRFKIIGQYPENLTPSFRSTEQSFVVTLKNLNFDKVSTPRGDNVGVDDGVEKNVDLILNALSEEPGITQKEIVIKTGLSARTVSREMKKLRDTGIIRRIGSARSGYWEITK